MNKNKYRLVGLIPKDNGSGGGAWLGTLRLFKGLNLILGNGKLKLFLAIKNLDNDFVETIHKFGISKYCYFFMALCSRLINRIILQNKNKNHFSFNLIPSVLDFTLYKCSKKGLNLYLHWVGNNFVSIWLIKLITKKKNVLIKFADYWWLTGGCHYPKNCDGFKKNNCIDCPAVRQNLRWIPANLFLIKRKILNKKNIKIISPSKHLYGTTKKIISNPNIFYIPNGIEIKPYQNRDFNKKSIGIIAHGLRDPRKNFSQLKDVFALLLNQESLIINICGDSTDKLVKFYSNNKLCELNNYGYIKDDLDLQEFYLNSNHILFFSIKDNSPNQIMEAMSYGSIMIAFYNNFTKENILHNHNGYLLSKFLSKEEIIANIKKIMNMPNKDQISLNAYYHSKSKFSQEKMSYKYSKLLN